MDGFESDLKELGLTLLMTAVIGVIAGVIFGVVPILLGG